MRKTISVIAGVTLLIALQGCQSITEHLFLPTDGVRQAEYSTADQNRVAVPMRDGTVLYADVYHPITSERTPTILVRIPFSNSFSNRFKSALIARYWARRGYHVVIQGTRGRYQSEGIFYPLRNERHDGIDTLQWLKRQSWFDGRLGMWGGSAFGYSQWVLYDQDDPGVGAFNIQIASTSFYDMFYPGGGFSLESALFWAIRSHKGDGEVATQEELDKATSGFPLIAADDRGIADINYFNDWVQHSIRDEYWKSIDGDQRAKRVKAPVMLSAGWFDPFLPSQIRDFQSVLQSTYARVADKSRLIIGPWAHAETVRFPGTGKGEDYRDAVLGPSVEWFDQILKFKSNKSETQAPVRIYVMGENVWRDEQTWPLQRTKYTKYYLASDGNAGTTDMGGLILTSGVSTRETDTFTYDPENPVPSAGGAVIGINAGIKSQNEIEQRNDVLVFSTKPLTEDTEVTGPVTATLYVATTAPNTDFTVKLVDVHPGGVAYNVSDGLLRKSYRNLNHPEPEEVSVNLWPTSMLFKKGHRIRIEVSSSNYPRYDRNPNTGTNIATENKPVTARQTIFHSKEYPSYINLPIIPR